jgi:hypothetical protein
MKASEATVIAVGVALGIAIALDSVGFGIGMGLAIGIAGGFAFKSRKPADYAKDLSARDRRQDCLARTETRTSVWWHLWYAMNR